MQEKESVMTVWCGQKNQSLGNTVWHHLVLPCDAKQWPSDGFSICTSHPWKILIFWSALNFDILCVWNGKALVNLKQRHSLEPSLFTYAINTFILYLRKKTLSTSNFPIQKYKILYHATRVFRFRAYVGFLLLQWRYQTSFNKKEPILWCWPLMTLGFEM